MLLQAKAESDRRNYRAKNELLRQLLSAQPHRFVVDSDDGRILGLTHPSTGFRIHMPRGAVPDGIQLRRLEGVEEPAKTADWNVREELRQLYAQHGQRLSELKEAAALLPETTDGYSLWYQPDRDELRLYASAEDSARLAAPLLKTAQVDMTLDPAPLERFVEPWCLVKRSFSPTIVPLQIPDRISFRVRLRLLLHFLLWLLLLLRGPRIDRLEEHPRALVKPRALLALFGQLRFALLERRLHLVCFALEPPIRNRLGRLLARRRRFVIPLRRAILAVLASVTGLAGLEFLAIVAGIPVASVSVITLVRHVLARSIVDRRRPAIGLHFRKLLGFLSRKPQGIIVRSAGSGAIPSVNLLHLSDLAGIGSAILFWSECGHHSDRGPRHETIPNIHDAFL
jgi:hypothetical protein